MTTFQTKRIDSAESREIQYVVLYALKHCRSIRVLSWPLVTTETSQLCVCVSALVYLYLCNYTHAAGSICVKGFLYVTGYMPIFLHLLPNF